MFMGRTRGIIAVLAVSIAASGILTGQLGAVSVSPVAKAAPTPGDAKKFAYKGINIGMASDAVRAKLGGPKEKTDTLDLYVFSDNESAQFYYDAAHLVTAIMITYTGDLKGAPTAKDVFGEDVAPKADGGVSRMDRYAKEGFWISYNRTAGNDAIVNIALQKM